MGLADSMRLLAVVLLPNPAAMALGRSGKVILHKNVASAKELVQCLQFGMNC